MSLSRIAFDLIRGLFVCGLPFYHVTGGNGGRLNLTDVPATNAGRVAEWVNQTCEANHQFQFARAESCM